MCVHLKRGTGARAEDVLAEEERWMLMAPWEKMALRGPRWWVDTLGPTWVNMGKSHETRMEKNLQMVVSMVFYTYII